MKIVFATNNQHKLQEIRDILGSQYEVVSLKEIGCEADIPETGSTLEENALQKAQYIYDHYHVSCFADDTGLEVEALDGAPGVHSARYAEGTDHDSEANMSKLLRELNGKENRKARFRTVICYIEKQDVCPCGCTSIKKIHQFEGFVNGTAATEIDTLADLVSYSRLELMKFRNFGRKSLNEIDQMLDKMKLTFGMDVTKYNIEPKKKNNV